MWTCLQRCPIVKVHKTSTLKKTGLWPERKVNYACDEVRGVFRKKKIKSYWEFQKLKI